MPYQNAEKDASCKVRREQNHTVKYDKKESVQRVMNLLHNAKPKGEKQADFADDRNAAQQEELSNIGAVSNTVPLNIFRDLDFTAGDAGAYENAADHYYEHGGNDAYSRNNLGQGYIDATAMLAAQMEDEGMDPMMARTQAERIMGSSKAFGDSIKDRAFADSTFLTKGGLTVDDWYDAAARAQMRGEDVGTMTGAALDMEDWANQISPFGNGMTRAQMLENQNVGDQLRQHYYENWQNRGDDDTRTLRDFTGSQASQDLLQQGLADDYRWQGGTFGDGWFGRTLGGGIDTALGGLTNLGGQTGSGGISEYDADMRWARENAGDYGNVHNAMRERSDAYRALSDRVNAAQYQTGDRLDLLQANDEYTQGAGFTDTMSHLGRNAFSAINPFDGRGFGQSMMNLFNGPRQQQVQSGQDWSALQDSQNFQNDLGALRTGQVGQQQYQDMLRNFGNIRGDQRKQLGIDKAFKNYHTSDARKAYGALGNWSGSAPSVSAATPAPPPVPAAASTPSSPTPSSPASPTPTTPKMSSEKLAYGFRAYQPPMTVAQSRGYVSTPGQDFTSDEYSNIQNWASQFNEAPKADSEIQAGNATTQVINPERMFWRPGMSARGMVSTTQPGVAGMAARTTKSMLPRWSDVDMFQQERDQAIANARNFQLGTQNMRDLENIYTAGHLTDDQFRNAAGTTNLNRLYSYMPNGQSKLQQLMQQAQKGRTQVNAQYGIDALSRRLGQAEQATMGDHYNTYDGSFA